MSDETPNVKISQGYEVLTPKQDRSYPIPCTEWDFLKNQIDKTSATPWLLQNIGSVFLGASLATLSAILIGAVPSASGTGLLSLAWVIFVACLFVGLVCYVCAHRESGIRRSHSIDVVKQMEMIELRFESREMSDEKATVSGIVSPGEPQILPSTGTLTKRQLFAIREHAVTKQIDVDLICRILYKREVRDLDRHLASDLIAVLSNLKPPN